MKTISTRLKQRLLVVVMAMFGQAAAGEGRELVFRGRVEEIEISTLPPPALKEWVVTFAVDRVEHGEFPGRKFSFRVHSPSRSGLEKGRSYQVRAEWTEDGYTVDEFQWLNAEVTE